MIEVRRPGPWTTAQVRVVVACDVLAALVLVFASRRASTSSLRRDVLWLNVAVLCTVLAVVATGALFFVARRAVGRRRLALLPDVLEQLAPSPATPIDDGWWWLPGTTRAHHAGCQMIAGKPAEEVSADRIRAHRLARCELCG